MVSDYLNSEGTWIEVVVDNLSDENKEILNQIDGEDIIKCPYHPGCLYFGVNYHGLKAQKKLLELAQNFKMQDVPYKEAYMTLPEFLMTCGCYKEIDNPNYIPMLAPWEMNLSIEDYIDYFKKYDEWENSEKSKKKIKIFDKTKVEKDIEVYLADKGAFFDNDKVYLSEYHYQKHLNYIKYLTYDAEIISKKINI